jgi:hypothetical protein
MQKWEYCEVDFDGSETFIWMYDQVGDYIDKPIRQKRMGIVLAQLGDEGWEIISAWWRSKKEVTYILKRSKEE